ncbi:MAG TPA: hypothetical protein PLI09_14585 [Candidatus Hydrogenedentes bacterium]|nr:hypothetical protein [Candidatus Hydrogenedentota bacterium]
MWLTTYSQRMQCAMACSLACHLLLFLAPWSAARSGIHIGPMPRPPAVVLNFKHPEPAPAPVRQLVDVHTPANAPVAQNDLIAVENSNATDIALRDGTKPGPHLDQIAGHDSLTPPAPVKPVEETVAPPPPMPEIPSPTAATPPPESSPPLLEQSAAHEPKPREKKEIFQVAKAYVPPPFQQTPESPPETMEMPVPKPEAAPAPPEIPENVQSVSRGRLYDKVNTIGFPGFEASKDQVAPYLHEVRRRVEKRWNAALLTRYSGVSPTEVVIDCAIASDGRLARVEIVGEPEDRVYAALCKEAVEKAGPFKPFPFKVPDMYRNKNLEIRWTFSFL